MEDDGSFTRADAKAIIAEVREFLTQAEKAIERNEYVHAEAWMDRALEAIKDQDVFHDLAAMEAYELAAAAESREAT